MRVNELADAAGVTPETVRYYTRIGLLDAHRNPANGYKEFHGSDVQRLQFIRQAQQLGLTLKDISGIQAQAQRGDSPCPQVRNLVQERLTELHGKIAELQALEARLSTALTQWSTMPDGTPSGDHVCHLIENWATEADS